MKIRFKPLALFYALLAVLILSCIIMQAGVNFRMAFAIALVVSMIPAAVSGVAYDGINQEIWTDVMVEDFRTTEEASFLNKIPDESRYVTATRGENEIIHLNDIGADPEILINNTTYPIGMAAQSDGDIPISLDKYQSVATKVTDDEIKFIAYDKIRKVQEKHTRATMKIKHQKAVHALAPGGNTVNTPVLITTGADDGTGRKRLVYKDLFNFKVRVDDAGVPEDDRTLILCSDHYNDLLLEHIEGDKKRVELANLSKGKFEANILDFDLYRYIAAPLFNPATLAKKSFGAAAVAGDRKASVFFYGPDMFRATGSTKQYADEPDTQTQAWLYNIRHYFVVLPRKQRAIGAIVSNNV